MSEENNINKILGRTQEGDRDEITRLHAEAAELRAQLARVTGERDALNRQLGGIEELNAKNCNEAMRIRSAAGEAIGVMGQAVRENVTLRKQVTKAAQDNADLTLHRAALSDELVRVRTERDAALAEVERVKLAAQPLIPAQHGDHGGPLVGGKWWYEDGTEQRLDASHGIALSNALTPPAPQQEKPRED